MKEGAVKFLSGHYTTTKKRNPILSSQSYLCDTIAPFVGRILRKMALVFAHPFVEVTKRHVLYIIVNKN